MVLKKIIRNLPEVRKPSEKKLGFNIKLKWTLIILVAFFILLNIPLHGLSSNSLERFEFLAVVLGTDFGSIISLGIGPIVMSSIILQLLSGAGILGIDTKTEEGKKYFQGIQKIGVLFFIVFESMIFVLMRGLEASPGFTSIVITQLILGGLAIMLMDEVSSKWGFGSGVSIFIVAGVSLSIFVSLFQFIGPTGENCLTNFGETACTGKFLVILQSIINGAPTEALLALMVIAITVVIFLGVVWAQSLKVEIPLSYDRLRGYGVKWPLSFFYASVIPVILVSALSANIQLFGSLLENWRGSPTFLGGFSNGQPISGLAYWLGSSNLVESFITGSLRSTQLLQGLTHLLFYMFFAMIFSIFWVKTTGMDSAGQAKNILSSGLQLPGFRKDQRILESILNRYVMPLTVMGGLAIGALAAIADLLGALISGTAILLAVMIIYQLYQNIAKQHAMDMHPAMKKIMS
ncbi:preprotein translocase subunit SecY [Candidatus Parvarchaeota archaeon]|nr:MAG: preprotein translocase subunit SecY [Candidatus Parvarchaeota archaeon]HIG51926.1 preprotein translocase subunit SecY [Candidatus Pacearchaeota archaeon]